MIRIARGETSELSNQGIPCFFAIPIFLAFWERFGIHFQGFGGLPGPKSKEINRKSKKARKTKKAKGDHDVSSLNKGELSFDWQGSCGLSNKMPIPQELSKAILRIVGVSRGNTIRGNRTESF